MNLDTMVDIHPRRVRTVEEVDLVLSKLDTYERQSKSKGVVVVKQNRQLGGSYRIVSEQDAIDGINNPRKCEWYVDSYSRAYFETLREQLIQSGQLN